MKLKTGDIILLTKRDLSFNPRSWSSWLISLSGKYTHTAIIYSFCGDLYVRDVDICGNESILLSDYIEKYKHRITIKSHPYNFDSKILYHFNTKCRTEYIKYDFANLFIFQFIKFIFHKFVGKETKLKRTCSEDTSRMFNLLDNIFENPEEITPTEVAEQIKKWQTI